MRITSLIACLVAVACSGADEAVPVELEVVASAAGLGPATTDLDYEVTLTTARIAVRDIVFTIEGEEEESGVLGRVHDWLVPSAHAHPGHSAGGEVTGELLGDFVVDFSTDGAPIGTATLLTGDYHGANFDFRRADELAPTDPLAGHTVELAGTATRGDQTWTVSVVIDVDDGVAMIGAPFDLELRADTRSTLRLELDITDHIEGETAFDGMDFASLDADGDGEVRIVPGDEDENRLRRRLVAHDHYLVH